MVKKENAIEQPISQAALMFDNLKLSDGVRLIEKTGNGQKASSLQQLPEGDTYSSFRDTNDMNKVRLSKSEYKNFIERHGNYSRPGLVQSNILRAHSLNTQQSNEEINRNENRPSNNNIKMSEIIAQKPGVIQTKSEEPPSLKKNEISNGGSSSARALGKAKTPENNFNRIKEEENDEESSHIYEINPQYLRDPDESIQGVLNSLNGLKAKNKKEDASNKISVKSPEMLRAMLFD